MKIWEPIRTIATNWIWGRRELQENKVNQIGTKKKNATKIDETEEKNNCMGIEKNQGLKTKDRKTKEVMRPKSV